ncbi:Fumble family protein [Histomonas meleagridis]|uniref:Fumble family protein n=1 Tax=Histomonas meleagridis TaxID=135588 RepID=UPI00355A4719|nr:Fumble family protein [Histomonas meleagridis]KAH0805474.1 Fumble family protein [Histomonas meleagridis]
MIGVDFGSTFVKVALLKDNGEILCQKFHSNFEEIKEYFTSHHDERIIHAEDFKNWCAVGAGSYKFRNFIQTLHIPSPIFEDEMRANAKGVAYLLQDKNRLHIHGGVGKISDRYIIASMGTGVSFTLNYGNETKHIGSSPIGGGTLMALSKLLLGVTNFDELYQLASKGKPENVDLMIEDLVGEDYGPTLVTGTVASSMAKAAFSKERPSDADIASSLIATVSFAIGTHVSSICGSEGIDTCIFISGFLDKEGMIANNLRRSVNLFQPKVTLVVPDYHHYVGAIGAALFAREKK